MLDAYVSTELTDFAARAAGSDGTKIKPSLDRLHMHAQRHTTIGR
jgi:hypothetical protein